MDAIDREILRLVQDEGRITNATLAESVRLSPSPCLRRLKRLEREGVISGYRAILDRPRIGLDLTVFVEIRVAGHTDETATELQNAFLSMDEVVACHIVSGPADFLLEVVVTDLRQYERLLLGQLLKLKGVDDVRSNFAIRTVKANGSLPLGHLSGSIRPAP
jgi:Lrp/AsnC family transcriptional regulator, leucine-responsive regulatory protein